MLTRNPHRPAHLLLDNTLYFITASTYQKKRLLDDCLKNPIIQIMHEAYAHYHWQLKHWVVLDNHYHLMAHSHKGQDLGNIIGRVHFEAGQRVRETHPQLQHVWWNYWDYCPRAEHDAIVQLNYLLNNPVKHGYVQKLQDYPYSSFHQFLDDCGREALVKQFQSHPGYRDLQIEEDEF